MHLAREGNNRVPGGIDLLRQGRCGRQMGSPQPVMAHHALLVGISNRAFLQCVHRFISALDGGLHLLQVGFVEVHAAYIDAETHAPNGT